MSFERASRPHHLFQPYQIGSGPRFTGVMLARTLQEWVIRKGLHFSDQSKQTYSDISSPFLLRSERTPSLPPRGLPRIVDHSFSLQRLPVCHGDGLPKPHSPKEARLQTFVLEPLLVNHSSSPYPDSYWRLWSPRSSSSRTVCSNLISTRKAAGWTSRGWPASNLSSLK